MPVVTDAVGAAAAWRGVPLSLAVEAVAADVEAEMRLADCAVALLSAVLTVLPALSTGEAELEEGFPIPPQAARISTGIAAIVRYMKALRIRP
jgi:hypothetical protein